jgi:hypothetical protein
VTLVISEAIVVGCGIVFTPRGLFDRTLLKSIGLAIVAGAAMLGVALLLKPISLFVAVPVACLVYAAIAWFGGAVQPTTADMISGKLGRVLAKVRR